MTHVWIPNSIERKCLQQLDHPGSWEFLHVDPPAEADILPWRPFRRIFVFNFVLFAVILTVFFFGLEVASGTEMADLKSDLPYGIAFAGILGAALGFYSTHLYRRSWNRRAKQILWQQNG